MDWIAQAEDLEDDQKDPSSVNNEGNAGSKKSPSGTITADASSGGGATGQSH